MARDALNREENRNFLPDDVSNYQVVQPGNLVINKMKAWQGSLGISPQEGLVSPAYYVFRVSFDDPAYLHVLLRSRPWVDRFAQASDGVRIGQWDLSNERMKRIPILIPHPDEQQDIVRFLAWSDRQIDRLLALYRRLVGISKSTSERKASLLFEYRIRLIADVVTGKLDVRKAAATLPEEAKGRDDIEGEDEGDGEEAGDLEMDD